MEVMQSRSIWGSYIENDHIDHLFRTTSCVPVESVSRASSHVFSVGGGGGGGLRRPTFTTVDESHQREQPRPPLAPPAVEEQEGDEGDGSGGPKASVI